jgi:membrane fusion protein (multidrug efflux system)
MQAAAVQILAQRDRKRRAGPGRRCPFSMSITKTINALSTAAGASRRHTPEFKWKKIGLVRAYLFDRPLVTLVSALLLLISLVFGVRYYLHMRSHEITDDAFIDAYITEIAPQVAGHVIRVHIEDNQHVNAGELLVELEPSNFESRLAAARAALQEAEARHRAAQATVEQTRITARGNIAEASSGVTAARAALEITHAQVRAARDRERQAQAAITAAQAQCNAAEAEARRADTDLGRYQRLYDAGLVSHQQLDQATTATQTANARVIAARAHVDVARAAAATAAAEVLDATTQEQRAKAQMGQARGRLTGTEAWHQQVNVGREQANSASESVEQSRANVRMAELQLSYTKIYAPIAGRITRRSVQVGNQVQTSQALMAIVPDDLYVTANFKETQLRLMRPGQTVEIRIDAFPDKIFKGRVHSIQRGSGAAFSLLPAENATGNYVKIVQRVPVKIVFDERPDSSYPLGPGMSVVPEVRVR